MKSFPRFFWRTALTLVVTFSPTVLFAQHYIQTNLVSPTKMEGTNPPDPSLKNPWGMARGTNIFWWVSDNVTGVSTLYDGSGVKQTFLTVTIPHTSQTSIGSPTGIVFNGSHDFSVPTGMPGIFIFEAPLNLGKTFARLDRIRSVEDFVEIGKLATG